MYSPSDRDLPGNGSNHDLSRRQFLKTASVAVAATSVPTLVRAAAPDESASPESLVARLHATMTDAQKKEVCFDWDHHDPKRGLLRTFVANNWKITKPEINGEFYTGEQRDLIRSIFEGMIQPEWQGRFDRQMKDDAGGFGNRQSIAIFGKPGDGKFEFVMTGRHSTLRCDGNSQEHVAFGGPIFYGHAAGGFEEKSDHPGNVFWPQALAANSVFEMLDGKQRRQALVDASPRENAIAFGGSDGPRPGMVVADMSADQKKRLQEVLATLVEPYRQSDRDEVQQCLRDQGGLESCSLAFYRDRDLGSDGVWDNWRLEGPSFVWYFRGAPHVHVWVHVADRPDVVLNA